MSEYGLSVFHDGKSLNLSHASPLAFIDVIKIPHWNLNEVNEISIDYSNQCPPGSKMVYICSAQFWAITSSTSSAVTVVKLNIGFNDRTVHISNEKTRRRFFPRIKPGDVYVFAIYPTVSSFDGYGLGVYDAGAFPLIVDSSRGMFMTHRVDVIFTGNLKLPVSSNSIVFCHYNAADIGVEYNPATQQILGYKLQGLDVSQSLSIKMKILAFDMKSPSMSNYGIAIYGRDGKVAFSSNEVPMLVRDFVNTPPRNNSRIALDDWHQSPMVPVCAWGMRYHRNSWYKVNAGMSQYGLQGSVGPIFARHDVQAPEGTTIAYANKPLPVLWASDYF